MDAGPRPWQRSALRNQSQLTTHETHRHRENAEPTRAPSAPLPLLSAHMEDTYTIFTRLTALATLNSWLLMMAFPTAHSPWCVCMCAHEKVRVFKTLIGR